MDARRVFDHLKIEGACKAADYERIGFLCRKVEHGVFCLIDSIALTIGLV